MRGLESFPDFDVRGPRRYRDQIVAVRQSRSHDRLGFEERIQSERAELAPDARLLVAPEWRQRVAWSYYIENDDASALAMANTVRDGGSGAWVGEGDWAAGLAAWRLGDCAGAADAFRRAAGSAQPCRGWTPLWSTA